jgi:hypothetical protein
MTELTQEGAPEATEQEELAVPDVSQAEQEVQQPSVPQGGIAEDRIEELLKAQEKRFQEMEDRFERMAQSAKDRGISKNAQEISAIRQQLEALGGDWGALQQQAERQTLYDRIDELEARISQGPASPMQMPSQGRPWQEEWRDESQKILDAAAKSGVQLTKAEYNAAMFNNDIPFATKGDAYAALNQAILAKAKGENISIAAVATEGGDVAKPPAPPAEPKTATQRFEEAKAKGDYAEMERIQSERWENVEKLQKRAVAEQALRDAGVSPEELLE